MIKAIKKLRSKIIPWGLMDIVNINKKIIKGINFFWKKIKTYKEKIIEQMNNVSVNI